MAGFRVRLRHGHLLSMPAPSASPDATVDALAQIRAFLATVRRHLLRQSALRAALYGTAALTGLALALPLLALALAAEHGPTLGGIGLLVAAAVAAWGAIAGALGPGRRWRSDHGVARHVGRQAPTIASDLLSSVELGQALDTGGEHASPALTLAFIEHTARRATALDMPRLVPRTRLRHAARACGSALVIAVLVTAVIPGHLQKGWRQLVHAPAPGPWDGARLSSTPLVGDMRVVLEYPSYTNRPPQELPSTSGDFRAMPGTSVTIETRALAPVTEARLLMGPAEEALAGEHGAPAAALPETTAEATTEATTETAVDASTEHRVIAEIGPERRRLRATFQVRGAATYRFWIKGTGGQRQVEALPRRIEIEPDRVPGVQLFTPADELDVTSLKRVELAYIAEDDYGIAELALVWDNRGRSERRVLPLPEPGRLSAQNKFLWDLAELSLEPGVPVSYHLEVTDNDTVSGPKVARSRSFVLRVFSPREKHEQMIARQRELFEKMIRVLGDRLVVPAGDLRARQVLGRDTAALVVEMGTLLAALAGDEMADEALRQALAAMRDRIDGLAKAERTLLDKLASRGRDDLARGEAGQLAAANTRQVSELEDDVLLLANWLDRQQMENMLAISDEIKLHQDRLRQLFDELERTGDSALLAEIEREMRALEARLAEMAAQRTGLPEDVLDRFVHAEAMQGDEAQGCVDQARTLLTAGDAQGAQRQMERCMKTMDDAAGAMEQALRALRGDTFSEEERRFGQLMDDLADMAQDQRDLAADADALWEQYAARADEMMRDKASETRRQIARTLERLRRQLDRIPESGLTPFAREELEIVGARMNNLDEMLADGDLAESLAMARQIREGLEIMAEELRAALLDEEGQPWGERTDEAQRAVQRARPLARQLVEELEAQTPSPEQIMDEDDRRRLDRLRRRQQAVAERARRLGERAEQGADQLPGGAGPAMARGVADARQQMGRATDRMRHRDPSGARHESRAAAESLQRALGDAQGAARQRQNMGRAGLHDEPIRIPGADEYRPPEEFREDILEAMKREQAPDGFGELVKRYYEELIR